MGDPGITSGGRIGNRQLVGPSIGPNPQQQTGHDTKRLIENEPNRREPAAVGDNVPGEDQNGIDNVGVGTRTTAHHPVVDHPPPSELVGIFEVGQRSTVLGRYFRRGRHRPLRHGVGIGDVAVTRGCVVVGRDGIGCVRDVIDGRRRQLGRGRVGGRV
ncbi:MAG: hypothetical protein OEW83_17790 [Acidimicrobiia bacterium]|nr:hypothetical protein [Acidimicrobiia bacterium]